MPRPSDLPPPPDPDGQCPGGHRGHAGRRPGAGSCARRDADGFAARAPALRRALAG